MSDGLIAVAGSDHSTWRDAQGKEQYRVRAAGVRLIDTHTWTVRTLEEDATSFQTGSGVILAIGGSWDSSTETRDGVGIAAYDLSGRERYRLHTGENVWLNAAASLGYIYLGGEGECVEIVDLATGAILRRLDRGSRDEWPYFRRERLGPLKGVFPRPGSARRIPALRKEVGTLGSKCNRFSSSTRVTSR